MDKSELKKLISDADEMEQLGSVSSYVVEKIIHPLFLEVDSLQQENQQLRDKLQHIDGQRQSAEQEVKDREYFANDMVLKNENMKQDIEKVKEDLEDIIDLEPLEPFVRKELKEIVDALSHIQGKEESK